MIREIPAEEIDKYELPFVPYLFPENNGRVKLRIDDGRHITLVRKKMAMMPEGAEPMENKVGTAPGMFLRYKGKLIFSTPGVPREMRGMLDRIVELAGRGDLNYISNEVRISGIMESTFAPYVMEIMDRFEGRIFVKSHPESIELRDPILTIEVYGYSTNKEELSRDIEEAINSVKEISGNLGGKISQ